MKPKYNLTHEDIRVIRKRLTTDHLVNRTIVFRDGQKKMSVEEVIARFEGYWKTWVENDLKLLFDYVDQNLIVERDGLQYMQIKDGVEIYGPGYKRTILNSWYG